MSGKLMGELYYRELDRPSELLLRAIADHASDDGTGCRPSVARLAFKVRRDRRTVQRGIRKLQERGVLVEVAPASQHRPAEYRIDLSVLPVREFQTPARGRTKDATPEDDFRGGTSASRGGTKDAAPDGNAPEARGGTKDAAPDAPRDGISADSGAAPRRRPNRPSQPSEQRISERTSAGDPGATRTAEAGPEADVSYREVFTDGQVGEGEQTEAPAPAAVPPGATATAIPTAAIDSAAPLSHSLLAAVPEVRPRGRANTSTMVDYAAWSARHPDLDVKPPPLAYLALRVGDIDRLPMPAALADPIMDAVVARGISAEDAAEWVAALEAEASP